MILLLDVGNTRIKWAYSEAGRLIEGGAETHEGKPADRLAVLDIDEPEAIYAANVTGMAHELAMTKVCVARWQHRPAYARTGAEHAGLRNAYAEPQRLGVDRWLALLGAWTETRGACVVVDAGTALTADAVDASGQHQGGYIAAGLATSEKAVLGATRFPTRETPLPVHAGLGRDTEACVRQGAMLSVLGAIDRAAALQPGARLFLTGGDAATLAPHLPPGWALRPHLVLEGLLALFAS